MNSAMQIPQNESEPSGFDLPFVLNCFELAEIFLSKSELHKNGLRQKSFPSAKAVCRICCGTVPLNFNQP